MAVKIPAWVVNGDLSQVDLPRGVIGSSGRAGHPLHNVKGIGSVTFSANDVVRQDCRQNRPRLRTENHQEEKQNHEKQQLT